MSLSRRHQPFNAETTSVNDLKQLLITEAGGEGGLVGSSCA
jgi:hypothetical protein